MHTEAQAAGVYVQNKDGGEFDGWCWPGSYSYVDFTNPKGKALFRDISQGYFRDFSGIFQGLFMEC